MLLRTPQNWHLQSPSTHSAAGPSLVSARLVRSPLGRRASVPIRAASPAQYANHGQPAHEARASATRRADWIPGDRRCTIQEYATRASTNHPAGTHVLIPPLLAPRFGPSVDRKCGHSSFPRAQAATPAEPDYKPPYYWMASCRVRASPGSVSMAVAKKRPPAREATAAPQLPVTRHPGVVAPPSATAPLVASKRYCCASPQLRSALGRERHLGEAPEIEKGARRGRNQKRVEGERVWLM